MLSTFSTALIRIIQVHMLSQIQCNSSMIHSKLSSVAHFSFHYLHEHILSKKQKAKVGLSIIS